MKKLKNILTSKKFYFFIILITIIYSFFIIKFNLYDYRLNKDKLEGIIIKKTKKNNYNSLIVRIKNKKVLVYDYQFNDLNIGDKVKINGDVFKPKNNTNFFLFNYKKYLKSNGIFYIVKAKNIKLLSKTKGIYKLKNCIIEYIHSFHNKYLNAFLLGDISYIDIEIKESFQINGISHLFAISGMHVNIFIFILTLVLRKKLKIKIDYIFIILFLLLYLFLVDYTKSIVRTTFLYIATLLNNKLNLKIDIKYLILMIACISIIINPYNIYNTGFLFTYVISLSLLFNKPLLDCYSNYVKKLFLTSFISFLVSIPILINSYFEINFISPFINLIYVPFISIIFFPLCILTIIFPPLNSILNTLSYYLENSSYIISKVDYFNLNFCHISFYIIIIYYIFIIIFICGIRKNNYLLFIPLILFMIIHYIYPKLDNCFYSIYLDVNQGDSSILVFPHNKSIILIDTGGNYNNKEIYKNIKQELKSRGKSSINYLIITHGDFDHMGEAINLVENFKVEKVIFNCGEFNDLEQELIRILNKKKIPYYSCIKELNISNNKLYFLQTKLYDNENDNSNVIYTEINGYKVMFMGDAGIEKEKSILEKYNISNIDVLKVGHHGSKTSSSKDFIDGMNPKYSIISVGKNNRYGHPNKEVLNVLNDSKIYRTDQDGSIMFKIKNNKLKIETCSP